MDIGYGRYFMDDGRRAVADLQRWLREISRVPGQIPVIYIDGIYGPETVLAVSDFQRRNGLPITGRTDLATFNAIFREFSAIIPVSERSFAGAENGVIALGDTFDGVLILQTLLRELAEEDESFFVNADGVFGVETENAVKRLQSVLGEAEDGRVTASLWRQLLALRQKRRQGA